MRYVVVKKENVCNVTDFSKREINELELKNLSREQVKSVFDKCYAQIITLNQCKGKCKGPADFRKLKSVKAKVVKNYMLLEKTLSERKLNTRNEERNYLWQFARKCKEMFPSKYEAVKSCIGEIPESLKGYL